MCGGDTFFHNLYSHGIDITGHIDSPYYYKRSSSRIEYKYEYQGEEYLRGNAIPTSKLMELNFNEGDEVVIRLDPENPKKAVIKDIYF
ncbi:hypothetical protein V7O66_00725 [Methanolobus sp. ZRKC3]|uniref:DUF3592 domain-containing protein n=1 Tax=Methanolobus sp. ZRKC3 TaxID=3125786 RepID=UPI00325664AA